MKPFIANSCKIAGAFAAAASLCAVLNAQVAPSSSSASTTTSSPPAQSDSSTTGSNSTTPPATAPMTDADSSSLSHHDKAFLKKAAKGGMKEVAVSQAVMDHLANSQVKDFAEKMIADHTAANTELASLAASKGVQLPPQDSSVYTDWSKKTDEVDKKYMKEMLSDHEDTVKLFKKASESKDAEIAAFAQKTLPTLEHHLEMAENLNNSIK